MSLAAEFARALGAAMAGVRPRCSRCGDYFHAGDSMVSSGGGMVRHGWQGRCQEVMGEVQWSRFLEANKYTGGLDP